MYPKGCLAPVGVIAVAALVEFATVGSVALGQTICDSIGPDVIVGDIVGVDNYSSSGTIEAFSVGTTSCNIGDEELLWIASSTQHPVIAQNMFRHNNGRFEQIGQAWLKHGFTALQNNACGCGCTPSGTGTRLGVGSRPAPRSTWTSTALSRARCRGAFDHTGLDEP